MGAPCWMSSNNLNLLEGYVLVSVLIYLVYLFPGWFIYTWHTPQFFRGNSERKCSCRHQVLEPCIRSKQPMSVHVLSVILVPCLQFSEFSQGNDIWNDIICWTFWDLSSIRSKASLGSNTWGPGYLGLAGHARHLKCQVCIHQPIDKGGERYKNIHTESLQLGPEFSCFLLLLSQLCWCNRCPGPVRPSRSASQGSPAVALALGITAAEAARRRVQRRATVQQWNSRVSLSWHLRENPMEIPMKSHNPRPLFFIRNPSMIHNDTHMV